MQVLGTPLLLSKYLGMRNVFECEIDGRSKINYARSGVRDTPEFVDSPAK